MKKTLLSSVILGTLFSTSVMAQETNWYERFSDRQTNQEEISFNQGDDGYFESSYFTLGVERLELTMEDSGNRYKGASMLNATYGIDMTRYISFEISGSLPVSSKVYENYEDRYYDFDSDEASIGDSDVTYPELTIDNYRNQIDPSYIVSANVKLDIPITERFSSYLTVGYSKSKISYQGIGTLYLNELNEEQFQKWQNDSLDLSTLTEQQLMIGFNDTLPLEPITDRETFDQYTPCELTGEEELCNISIEDLNEDYEQNGAMYGAGISFDYDNNTSIVLDYKKYAYNKRLDIEAIRLGIQWRF